MFFKESWTRDNVVDEIGNSSLWIFIFINKISSEVKLLMSPFFSSECNILDSLANISLSNIAFSFQLLLDIYQVKTFSDRFSCLCSS